MKNKKFQLWNRIISVIILVIASYTYISTIEASASFWDCGEFIASSYKLEVGHPPGNPVFQLFARFFTMFGGAKHAAVAVNTMSALCSGFTIMLLYLTIVFFAKRLIKKKEEYTLGQTIAIFGSAAIGSLCYCFSDTFWFSAVEGEVYAMSSLYTALVIWAMTKWYEQADEPHANKWIILICFLMGLSIGVHLLNLLTIPALVFLYFYRYREDGKYNIKQFIGIGILSVILLGIILFFIIPYIPTIAGYFDLFFVNVLGLPFNIGATIFMIGLLALCFWGAFYTYKHNKVLLNTAILGFTTIIIGFSVFSIVIIRSNVMPPTNEYQPDNAFTLVRYLSREQYGSSPILYGQYFGAPADLKTTKYWTPLNGKYYHATGPAEPVYSSAGKMLFPRMWNGMDDRYVSIYKSYMNGKGTYVDGATDKKPTFGANMSFFFDYQLDWMYWRYFMWNFAGRQNDIHSPIPGNPFYGNWECGIKSIDQSRLGDQSNAPEPLKNSKAKNHYYLLPLLLGLLGLCFQFDRDKRGWWVTFIIFFMTGIAIVLYINQTPLQVRERDYAYAGSFYAFAIWIGFAILALFDWICKGETGKKAVATACVLTCAGLFVPALMAEQNWDDHDRSHRKTAVEMAKNYLNSVGKEGILITHGDNDTFPLWYAQEVEGVRPDVRICNTSLLGTDWHIEQMKYACNKSKPLPVTVDKRQYLYGTNDYVKIYDTRDTIVPIEDVMIVFKSPRARLELQDGRTIDYIMSRKISIPVNKANVLKYNILPKEYADQIPDKIVITIPKSKDYISKPELFMLDLLSHYNWDRPINFLGMGGDINIGLKDYLMYDGFSERIIPIKNKITGESLGITDINNLYHKMTNVFQWKDLSRKDYFVDYENMYTFLGVISQRDIFYNVANALYVRGYNEKAREILNKSLTIMPEKYYPYDSICLGFYNNDITMISIIDLFLKLGETDTALKICDKFSKELYSSLDFYLSYYDIAEDQFKQTVNILSYLSSILAADGQTNLGNQIRQKVEKTLGVGNSDSSNVSKAS